MIRQARTAFLALALVTSMVAAGAAETEIRALIQAIAESGCQFDRNGSQYSAQEAAKHLERKYAQGKRYGYTAEQFIEHLASGSSWSGKPYWMICGMKTTQTGDWLTETLGAMRAF